jgi:hypothetical protein
MNKKFRSTVADTIEHKRLNEAREIGVAWKKWGPYLSERQWGTVREDYSDSGNAWDYFSHDQARSRTYRWGEDGLAGISDDKQRLCFALALWNGKDPILKERLFGLTNSEGNHGEDVKEYYFYLDSTPTHSYMKCLYKYPQGAYPYANLVETNRLRSRKEFEYELLDTGIFDDDRYFDVFIEYAKDGPEDILVRVIAVNRGPETAELHVLPTLWFRNDWAAWTARPAEKPSLKQIGAEAGIKAIAVKHSVLGDYCLHCEGDVPLLFTDNETNNDRLFPKYANASPYVKDGIDDYVVHGQQASINTGLQGTKVAAHHLLKIVSGDSATVRLRLTKQSAATGGVQSEGGVFALGPAFDKIFSARQREADEFYSAVIPSSLDEDDARVMRQALAGMLWSKQFYLYDVDRWLEERGSDAFNPLSKAAPRNNHWHHMYNGDIISMPDKWEYPWYAAWDLAFHVLALGLVDVDFAKGQLGLMLSERYLHPNGQIPAYEWSFSDVNPPVHAWATIFTYRLEHVKEGVRDTKWLKKCFQKLLLNFTWWVNRKDRSGRNVFEGGFLGLDNIGVFDRSAPLPTGGYLEQADGTAWMALYADNMLEIACELAMTDDDYADMVLKFLEHDTWITSSLVQLGGGGMWDEEDGFFYDVLRLPSGEAQRIKGRSMVGLLPFCAATPFEPELFVKYPSVTERFQSFMDTRPELCFAFHDPTKVGVGGRRLFSVLDENKLRRVLRIMLDENEFLSPYGIRSLSRYHAEHPYVFRFGDREYPVSYLPAESDTGMFGGNSNWRGPIWMPVNMLILRALVNYHAYYGDTFTIECPTGSGRVMNLYEAAEEIARRLASIFLRDQQGQRPVYGGERKFQEDPHWRDLILFYEYFHGDNGAGIGASHQTGWTGIVARIMHMFATTTAEQVTTLGQNATITETESAWSTKPSSYATR